MSLQQPPYSPRQALAIFKRAFTQEGAVLPTQHFREAMADPEDPFDDQDVLSVRATGAITTPPELNVKRGEWAYRVVGRDCEARRLAISSLSPWTPEPSNWLRAFARTGDAVRGRD